VGGQAYSIVAIEKRSSGTRDSWQGGDRSRLDVL